MCLTSMVAVLGCSLQPGSCSTTYGSDSLIMSTLGMAKAWQTLSCTTASASPSKGPRILGAQARTQRQGRLLMHSMGKEGMSMRKEGMGHLEGAGSVHACMGSSGKP